MSLTQKHKAEREALEKLDYSPVLKAFQRVQSFGFLQWRLRHI